MASVELLEEKDSSGLPISKGHVANSAGQLKEEGMDECPVKVRKPYTITKQREKWSEEEHEKFLEALKLYGRSWRQIQEHIGTKTAVQIRSHAQKFFSKVEREPAAKIDIEIPPPRPKRKPLHPYPRKCASSGNGANPSKGQPKLAPISSSSGSNQDNGSPVSVLSAMQSDAFGPSTRCASPSSSDDGNNNVPPLVIAEESNMPCRQTVIDDQSHKETEQDKKDKGMPQEDFSDEVQETSLKLFGKTVVIPTGNENSHPADQQTSQAPLVGEAPSCKAPNGWLLPYNSFPLLFGGETVDARVHPLQVWWPYYGFPFGHPRGFTMEVQDEATDESDTGKGRPPVESSSDCDDNAQTVGTKSKAIESLGSVQVTQLFELKPSDNSAFVRVKPNGSQDQWVRGFVPYKRCKFA